MTPETNKRTMHRFTEFINTASEKLATELISPNAIFHVPGRPDPLQGPAGYLEIIGMMRVTPVPQTPEHVKGVINLRGKVIPVIDLRIRFGMCSIEYTDRTCIVVVETDSDTGRLHIGIVVDSVSEVLNIKGSDIEETPEFGTTLNTDYILGMAKTAGSVKILLDIDRVLSASEKELIGEAA